MGEYRDRLLDPLLTELMGQLPAVMLVGPRATGKSTTAARHAGSVVQLDRPAQAAAFEADPDGALRGLAEPVLLDEWQAVPSVLGAVKRAIDSDWRPGRFILTGSVRADIEAETWPGTGRVIRLAMYPLTVAEQLHRSTKPLIDRILDGDELLPGSDNQDLRAYLDGALQSGFPEAALGLTGDARRRWLESYVDQLVTRDAQDLEAGRDPERLGRYFEVYALNSAGVVESKTLHDTAGINRKTAEAYRALLKNLLVIDELPAWSSNQLKRLIRSPKRYLVDPGLFVGALGLDVSAVMRNGDLLGRVLETHVVAQLRAEATVARSRPRLFHLRQEEGRREIDLVAEIQAGLVVAMEIKATSAPKPEDARHLAWLRDELGDAFIKGVVLHTGPRTFALGDRIVAAPISTLWA